MGFRCTMQVCAKWIPVSENRKNEFGVGGGAVLRMCEIQKRGKYKIYSGAFFTLV